MYEALHDMQAKLLATQANGDQVKASFLLQNIASIYMDLGKFLTAIDYYQSALTLAREISYPDTEAEALGGLGGAYQSLKEYQQALDFYQQALTIGDGHVEQRQTKVWNYKISQLQQLLENDNL